MPEFRRRGLEKSQPLVMALEKIAADHEEEFKQLDELLRFFLRRS